MPNVPTTTELGFPTIVSSSTRGLAAPKGTPPEAVKKLEAALLKAMGDPDHIKRMEDQGIAIKPLGSDAFAALWKEEHEKARKYTDWAKKRPQ